MGITILLIIVAALIVFRVLKKRVIKPRTTNPNKTVKQLHLSPWQKKLYTVGIFTKLSTKRFFRDRLAIFFGILFPLIFLFVFGALTQNSGKISINTALINQSKSAYAKEVVSIIKKSPEYKINKTVTTVSAAENKMTADQLSGLILIPKNFGVVQPGQKTPSGNIEVLYTENEQSSGDTITSLLQSTLSKLNQKFVAVRLPFSVSQKQLSEKSLTTFDYIFSGLLGFSIIGMGVFGPVNVFPELKKQGILRRLHTTPLRVWQYFLATMFSQALTGLVAIAIQFIVAVYVFHLKINGNLLEIILFTILSIFMILGIGLAIGGWAKNERQAAPLSNLIVFPMLFLSGTFFPRFSMPLWLQSVTNYLPLTPVIDGLRLLTTAGKNLWQIGPQIGLIAIWMVVIYIIAFRVFKWE